MSTHLLIAAAYLEGLPQGRKLVLMGIADSGDEHTLESAPGLPKLRAWSGLSKSAVLANIAALEAAQLIERVAAGRLGRRAVYRVFPLGVPPIPKPSEVAARYDSEPVDNLEEEGPADRTLGSCSTPSRVLPTGPLHSDPSVFSARTLTEPVETGRSASGFPGSRATSAADVEEARGIARRARGANDVPCPIHPGMIVPCGRCAHEAAKVTPEQRAANVRRLRDEARLAAAGFTPPPTEEPTP